MSAVTYQIRPLGQWADPETPVRRGAHVFKASWRDTLLLLGEEIEKIGGESPVVFQLDVTEGDVRMDGMLRANAKVGHPGVVISFTSKYGPLRYATDAYEQQYYGGMPSWQANIRAIALALQSLRAVDRYGVTKRGEQYVGWRAITSGAPLFASADAAAEWMRGYAAELPSPPSAKRWNGSLGALYRAMARRMHPDSGGERADWDRLDEARRVLEQAGMLT
jgi:hypothetical protein